MKAVKLIFGVLLLGGVISIVSNAGDQPSKSAERAIIPTVAIIT